MVQKALDQVVFYETVRMQNNMWFFEENDEMFVGFLCFFLVILYFSQNSLSLEQCVCTVKIVK